MQRQSAKMTKSETRQDGAKARALRDKARTLIGKTVEFNHYTFDAVQQKKIDTGTTLSGCVLTWDDTTQTLLISVSGFPCPVHVSFDRLITTEDKNV